MRFSTVALVSCCLWTSGSTFAQPLEVPKLDPCALLTRAEVEETIGKLKADPKPQQIERTKICEYQFVNAGDTLEIWLFPAAGLERARESSKSPVRVTDLGDDAFMAKNQSVDYLELFTRKNDVTIELTMESRPGAEEKLKSLARKALGRM